MAISQRQMTLEAFLKLPEQEPELEYIEGRVTKKVSPQGRHSLLQKAILEVIDGFARPIRLAQAFPELRTTWAGSSPVPDVSVYRWSRIPTDENDEIANDFTTPPDVAIEIRSPGQTRAGQIRRCRWYVERGVEISLLVDDLERTVRRFEQGREPVVLRGSDRVELDNVLPGFVLTVDQLFGALRLG